MKILTKSSSDLLLDASNLLLDESSNISSYLEKLKGGEISSPESSKFRVRRLTYAQKTAENLEPKSPFASFKRTTIYTSAGTGVRQVKVPPFPGDILGTYSNHGIEPIDYADDAEGEVDEDLVVDKINQDRGCIVNPFNSNPLETLFLVLDGHGEQGDRVSEFVMRQVIYIFFLIMKINNYGKLIKK